LGEGTDALYEGLHPNDDFHDEGLPLCLLTLFANGGIAILNAAA